MGRKVGRPPADPACGVPSELLERRSLGLLEPDDVRATHLASLIGLDACSRPVMRWRRLGDANGASAEVNAYSGWIIAHRVVDGSSFDLVARLRAALPQVPIYVTLPKPDFGINARCRALRARYWPGCPEARDVEVMLERVERYETAALPHSAYVVRRAMVVAARAERAGRRARRLLPHEMRFAAAELEGASVWDLTDGAGRNDRSASAVRSRALSKLGARSFDELRQERRLAWDVFGDEPVPPWKT